MKDDFLYLQHILDAVNKVAPSVTLLPRLHRIARLVG